MKNTVQSIMVILLVSLLTCCKSTASRDGEETVRIARDIPGQFNIPAGMAWGQNNCINTLIDPMDSTELILIRSTVEGMGDYRVAARKYGMAKGELLRINCKTGEVIGVVRK